MKKLAAACAILFSSYAMADIPAGFTELKSGNGLRTFINNTTNGVFSVEVSDAEGGAKDKVEILADVMMCESPVTGDASLASVDKCMFGDERMDITVIVQGKKQAVFYRDEKVSEADVKGFISDIFNIR